MSDGTGAEGAKCAQCGAQTVPSAPVDEPKRLLAVVADRQGRRYFRWSYDAHTFSPWRDIGAVHCDTDENFRWEDLRGARTPIEVVFDGIDES